MDLTLVILAAGIGSRFGGDKQVEPIGPNGELIIDFSIMDAAKAGFNKVVFVIRKEIEEHFRNGILKRANRFCDCEIVFQCIDQIPEGFSVPEGRTKPWGTAHALLAAKSKVNTPFAVINADDFYGRGAYFELSNFLGPLNFNGKKHCYCMIGYFLKNTVSEHGSVSRGVCEIDEFSFLKSVTEKKNIFAEDQKFFFEEGGKKTEIESDIVVSMNCLGFTTDFFSEIEAYFAKMLKNPKFDLMNDEIGLPYVLSDCIANKRSSIRLLPCHEKWLGFTYKEDRDIVKNAIADMIRRGIY